MKLSQLFNQKKRSEAINPAKITFRNVFAVIQALFRREREIGGFKLPQHIYEQIIWRRTQILAKSPMCWQSGSCIVCGCDILGKSMEDRGCSVGDDPELLRKRTPCYPPMMDKEKWKEYKRLNKIKLFD